MHLVPAAIAAVLLLAACGDDEADAPPPAPAGPPELRVSVGLRERRDETFRPRLRTEGDRSVEARVQVLNGAGGVQARRLRLGVTLPPGARLLRHTQSIARVKPPATPHPLRGNVTEGISLVPLNPRALRIVRFRFEPGRRGGDVTAKATSANASPRRASATLVVG